MRNLARFCLYVYIVLIFLVACLSLNGVSRALNETFILEFRADYLIHMGLFLFLMFLISRAYHVNFRTRPYAVVMWTSIAIFIAFIAEGVQYFLTYRAFNINDLIANILGVVLGMMFFIRSEKLKGAKNA